MVSAGLHVVGLFIFGIVKIAQAALREETTFEAPPIAEVPQEKPEYMVNLEQTNQSSSPPRPNPITVDSPDITLPALNIDLNIANASSFSRGTGGPGGNGGGMMSIREMAFATVFGIEVSATKLGVVLDVSRSTHSTIDRVIDEIQKEFKDAVIVFTPGCFVFGGSGEVVGARDYENARKKYPPKDRYATSANINRVLSKNKNFDRIWGRLRNEERGYVVFPEGDSQSSKAGIVGLAMDLLREEGVDTIYWFADFNDDIQEEGADELMSILQRGRITLFVHDFMAPLGSPKKRRSGDVEFLKSLTARTKGELFLKELK